MHAEAVQIKNLQCNAQSSINPPLGTPPHYDKPSFMNLPNLAAHIIFRQSIGLHYYKRARKTVVQRLHTEFTNLLNRIYPKQLSPQAAIDNTDKPTFSNGSVATDDDVIDNERGKDLSSVATWQIDKTNDRCDDPNVNERSSISINQQLKDEDEGWDDGNDLSAQTGDDLLHYSLKFYLGKSLILYVSKGFHKIGCRSPLYS